MLEVKLNDLRKQSDAMRESLRELRTNIRFCGDDIKTILFTSFMPNEGKSTVVIELARSLVEAGNKVLVVDSDMRKSVLVGRYHARTNNDSEIFGLSHFLSGQKSLENVIYRTQIPNLMMVFAGPAVINPTELLENRYYSDMLKFMRGLFDYVLIDCAPLGAAIDAAVIAKECDGAVIVISQGDVSCRAVQSIKRQLEASQVRILGAVLNKVDIRKSSYYGKYYGAYYGKSAKAENPREDDEDDLSDSEDIRKASMVIAKNMGMEPEMQNEK